MFRKYLRFAAFDCIPHELFQCFPAPLCDGFVHVEKPLQFRERLDNAAGALCRRDILGDLLFFDKQVFFFEPFEDNLTCFHRLFAFERSFDRHARFFVDNLRTEEVMSVCYFPIGMTVCRRDAERSGAE